MQDLQTVLNGDDRPAIDTAMRALEAATAEFAARRMNRGVQQALTGKVIDKVLP